MAQKYVKEKVMREIKFRGLTIDGKKMVYGDLLQYRVLPVIFDKNKEQHDVGARSIGQYTGLKDKNDKRIYEGDIVKNCWGIYKGAIGVVEWEDWGFEISIRKGDKRSFYDEMGSNFLDDELEVIGNIYKNSELLEKEKV